AARAEIAWLDGDADGVDEATRTTLQLAVQLGSAWDVGALTQWRRRSGLDTDTAPMAAPYLLEPAAAADLWQALGQPYEAAVILAEAAEETAQLRALEELQRLGARPAATLVANRLRQRGSVVPRGPRPSTLANAANVTARELDVLVLLAEGHRNAEIA